ncbi:A/G-specific adenine glycosylase [Aromatoleum evansii]|uniref:A/G-specific adenine glycosylase n=1 Tax=Aromatoleum evansii TaxID=59406 RepID=UPI00145D8554|nr:A/G-specific adenine glycosylase [Aromatoleum evansii]NMG27559.1 A/G-specific adenine glycosylase [Aromatoleum evansii]
MERTTRNGDFATRLIAWHGGHGRHDLPWQNTRDPYRIWLSEIMLQQTQVDTVIPYYARFLARFPDVASLAAAPVDDVLALWSGLGYYARARNLHKAAQVVVARHGGGFPRSAAEIAELPGIGRSTAAAIAAFAFDERAAILDGNVKRVLCRVFGIDGFPGERAVEQRLWALAEELLPHTGIGTYIQAQMDLGATLCTRGKPACGRCPMADICVALREERVAELPAARPKKAVPQRHARVAVIVADGTVLLERRPPTGIWGGLLALPEIPGDETDPALWVETRYGLAAQAKRPLPPLNHVFTHFRLEITPLLLEVDGHGRMAADADHRWLALNSLADAGLPTPVRRILAKLAGSGGDLLSPRGAG